MRKRVREAPAIGILERRRRLANAEAKSLVGALYGVMAAHFDYDPWMLAKLKNAAHWSGFIDSVSIAFTRYADGEPRAILEGRDRV